MLWIRNFLVRIRIRGSVPLLKDPDPNPANLLRTLVVTKSRSRGRAAFLCLKMRLGKNFRTKKNPKLTSGRIRIRNRIQNFCLGSATLRAEPDTDHWDSLPDDKFSSLALFLLQGANLFSQNTRQKKLCGSGSAPFWEAGSASE